jgi:hypothetical protein
MSVISNEYNYVLIYFDNKSELIAALLRLYGRTKNCPNWKYSEQLIRGKRPWFSPLYEDSGQQYHNERIFC